MCSYRRPDGWDWGALLPLICPPPAQGCRAAPSPLSCHSPLLTCRLSGPAQEQDFCFLRHAVPFLWDFQCGLYFLRSELKRSPTVSQRCCLPALGTAGTTYTQGENVCRSGGDVKTPSNHSREGVRSYLFTRTTWMRLLLNFSWNERRVGVWVFFFCLSLLEAFFSLT